MSKHTPGPWVASGQLIVTEASYGHDNPKAQPTQKLVGEVHWNYCGDHEGTEYRIGWDEAEANQRLMMSSPELLTALKECFSEPGAYAFASEDFYKAKQRLLAINNIVRDAVMKATGETIK